MFVSTRIRICVDDTSAVAPTDPSILVTWPDRDQEKSLADGKVWNSGAFFSSNGRGDSPLAPATRSKAS